MHKHVYVTGIGIISPLGLDTKATWDALLRGVSGIQPITAFDATNFETRIAAEVKNFDPVTYMDKRQARRLDRFTQFATAAAQEAVQQAALKTDAIDGTRASAIVGSGIGGIITLSQQLQVLEERGPSRVSPFLITMMLADMAPGHLSMTFGLKGLNFCPVSSCSSGADAIGAAWEMVRRGDIDLALAGGAEAPIAPIAIAGFNACQALSRHNEEPTKASRPFDVQRDGFVMGEGAAILVLENEESIQRRGGPPPLVELVAYGATSDAYHVTHPDPKGEGAARAMRLALERAGLRPQDIDYINAHGTSTPLNDKHETLAVKAVFGEDAYRTPISSTKSMTGHLLGAGGALEAAVCVLAIQNGAIPPTINLEQPDPECDLDYTLHLPRRGRVRTAMTNSLGFGGHNSCLIFQELPR